MDSETEAWVESRPPAVAAVVRRFPPDSCYRLADNPGHYFISSYSEPVDGGPVTVRLVHLDDSYLPAVEVFGVNPDDLRTCGCLVN